ncbi:alpha/beta fold hydrolase [Paenarthrobacter sp. NPDC057981]|uniref:alpha/beta fold hydrolase n=1 Tax=Paenarthrobacter sp. NPDC057981 TaxID=3346297 RepID=UPI0036DF82B7
MPTFTRDETAIAFTDTGVPAGAPDAQTIVFGHGLFFGGWMYAHQIEALSQKYRCVTIDWRGQGETPAASAGYDMDSLTADAVGLIEYLELGPVHWVGLSMGGFVGMRLAARHPQLLRSLTLFNTSSELDSPEANADNLKMAETIRGHGIDSFKKGLADVLIGPDLRSETNGEAVVEDWLGRLAKVDPNGLADAIRGVVKREPVTAELVAIEAPTLVVAGADDIAIPAVQGRAIASLIPGARFSLVPGAGHACTVDKPKETTEILEAFLEEIH